MEFNPALFLGEDDWRANTDSQGLLILNQPIGDFDVFRRLWQNTKFRICADGGANHLHDMFNGALEKARPNFLPDIIHGDLDSLRDDVRRYYSSHGVEISRDPDQYSSDFGKAMQKIASRHVPSTRREVLILGTLAGRVDQGLGLLHEMIREEARNPEMRLWLFSETNVSFILKQAQNVIREARSSEYFSRNVGILPIYGPATITTLGLEWDVTEWETQMGGQVSTSNHIMADEIHIKTSQPVLFTIERAPQPSR